MSDETLVASSTDEGHAQPPEKLTGISVYPGIAFGLCQHFSAGDLEVPQFVIERPALEVKYKDCAPPSPPSTSNSAPLLTPPTKTCRPKQRRSSMFTARSCATLR